jgi:transcriptional regulator with XRE-family HTH domain
MPEADKAPNEAPLHERIRQFREGKGLTRDDLAEMIGVTSITLYRWETGSTRPSPLAAEKLSSLGVAHIAPGDTNVLSVPRLKKITRGTSKNVAANDLQLESTRELHVQNEPQRWSCFFDQNAAQLRWIRVSHQAAIFMGSVLLAWTSSGVKMPWVEWGRSAL